MNSINITRKTGHGCALLKYHYPIHSSSQNWGKKHQEVSISTTSSILLFQEFINYQLKKEIHHSIVEDLILRLWPWFSWE